MNYFNENLIELICSKSKNHKHFVEKPVSLQCGHCVCKKCINQNLCETIECFHCGMINDRDVRYDNESVTTKRLIKLNVKSLCVEIENEMRKNILILKSK